MSEHATMSPEPPVSSPPPRRHVSVLRVVLLMLIAYLVISFLVMPALWRRYEKRHPALANAQDITHTGSGIPGDPLNLGLIGTEAQIHRAMLAAGWYPADPVTLASSIRIAVGVVFNRPFDEAPVSPLYLFGRKEDLAFEKPVGTNPRERHHVRFWLASQVDEQGRPFWFGAATFDTHVGFSHDTGQITHHIAADVDADRDLLIGDLQKAGALSKVEWIEGFHKARQGKNGGGDPWRTDGRLAVGVLAVNEPLSRPADSATAPAPNR